MAMIFVFGSGFGLYGHTAALAAMNCQVTTLARYKPFAEKRVELRALVPRIRWIDDAQAALSTADVIVFARRPEDNVADIRRALDANGNACLVCEKPMAATWRATGILENKLIDRRRTWAIPYLFSYCGWLKPLRERLGRGEHVNVLWQHRQAKNVKGWKNNNAQGGGALAFYFLHCLAVLETVKRGCRAEFKEMSSDEATRLCAMAELGQGSLTLQFELGAQQRFEIGSSDKTWFVAQTPFGDAFKKGEEDPRVPVLQEFYRREVLARDANSQTTEYYRCVTKQWRRFEETRVVF